MPAHTQTQTCTPVTGAGDSLAPHFAILVDRHSEALFGCVSDTEIF